MGKKRMKKLGVGIVVAVLLVAGGTTAGWLLADKSKAKVPYPLLDSSAANPKAPQNLINFDPLRQSLKAYFTKLGLAHSFYFEYLPDGINIRDGADETSVAASLMKTPVVMDLYKVAELGKVNLDDTVAIQQSDISTDADYGDPSGLAAGTTISLRNAAKLALHDSDNTAISVIKRSITPLVTNDSEVVQNLDINYTLSGNKPTDKILMISARSYSSILKCLYYSCFLQPKDSQELLAYLIGSSVHSRLMSGVPKNVQVAHKIGSGIKAQSDCGIVYQPGKPYLVCLMFWDYPNNGGNETDAYFKKVSQMVSDYVTKAGN